MALATRCPHCGTTFRVAHDQLKLRAGLVRCGACKEIFNGIEHLLRAEELNPSAEPPSQTANRSASLVPIPGADSTGASPLPVSPAGSTEAPGAGMASVIESESESESEPEPEPEPTAPRAEPYWHDPLQRMTLMDFSERTAAAGDTTYAVPNTGADTSDGGEELERAIEDLQRSPLRGARKWSAAEEPADPDFLVRARKQQRGSRARRALLAGATFLLLLGALGQTTYAFRSQIAAYFPQVKPLLATSCAALDCRIDLPRQIESVTIESSDLQALAPDQHTFALDVLLRNRSATVEAWPNIELTLNDTGEQPLVRRVLRPREYLPAAQSEGNGFAADAEQPLRIYFELATPKATGYRIYLFYS